MWFYEVERKEVVDAGGAAPAFAGMTGGGVLPSHVAAGGCGG
jgi:hypothetical protein